MTKSKKITIALLVSALLAGLMYCVYFIADLIKVDGIIETILTVMLIFLGFEQLLIEKLLYSIGIGLKVTLPGAGLNEDYPLGWVFSILINYLILSALAYLILSIIEKFKNQNKEK